MKKQESKQPKFNFNKRGWNQEEMDISRELIKKLGYHLFKDWLQQAYIVYSNDCDVHTKHDEVLFTHNFDVVEKLLTKKIK